MINRTVYRIQVQETKTSAIAGAKGEQKEILSSPALFKQNKIISPSSRAKKENKSLSKCLIM